jgi:hypothetical protein
VKGFERPYPTTTAGWELICTSARLLLGQQQQAATNRARIDDARGCAADLGWLVETVLGYELALTGTPLSGG